MLVTCFPGRMVGRQLSSVEHQESQQTQFEMDHPELEGIMSLFCKESDLIELALNEMLLPQASPRNSS